MPCFYVLYLVGLLGCNMNVYDFDRTIYRGDSTIDFYRYCLQCNPKIILYLPKQLNGMLNYLLGKCSKTEWKEQFFCFLTQIDDLDTVVKNFWDRKEKNIQQWYLNIRQSTDVIISASPSFLLREICMRLGINQLIASEVSKNGHFSRPNCYGEEKVVFFCEKFSTAYIEKFYSDSLSDKPMAKLARQAYLVKRNRIYKWPFD